MKEIVWVNTGMNMPLEALRPHPRNPKVHTKDQLRHIKNSILEFGFLDPIGVWGEIGQVVEGHGRLEALRELVREKKIAIPEAGVPVLRLDHLTSAQRDAYMIEHNQATMERPWETETLEEILAGISETIDMEGLFDIPIASMEELVADMPEEGGGDGPGTLSLIVPCSTQEDMEEKRQAIEALGIVCKAMGR